MADQKEIAIKCLETLDIYKPYIRRFKKDGMPCFFERFGGFYAEGEEALMNKIQEVQNEYGCLVYAITHEYMEFGECWSMLCVSADSESVDDCLSQVNSHTHYAFAYVWNKSADYCSEFGDVVVKSFGGGICRLG